MRLQTRKTREKLTPHTAIIPYQQTKQNNPRESQPKHLIYFAACLTFLLSRKMYIYKRRDVTGRVRYWGEKIYLLSRVRARIRECDNGAQPVAFDINKLRTRFRPLSAREMRIGISSWIMFPGVADFAFWASAHSVTLYIKTLVTGVCIYIEERTDWRAECTKWAF